MTPFSNFVYDHIKNPKMIGAEVGVRDGLNASYLMTYLPVQHLFLVDNFPVYDDGGVRVWNEADQKQEYIKLMKVALGYPQQAVLVTKPSTEARRIFLDFEPTPYLFDFVYIDADHCYKSVKEDLKWWDLVKTGGIMGGHDYGGPWGADVEKAVNEFVEKNSLKLNILESNRGGIEWAIIKT